MLPPALGTMINGKLYDFSSVQITVNSVVFTNITEINYSHGLDPGILRGTGAKWRGRSRGTYEADGGFTMYKEDYMALVAVLAAKGMGGYMEATFDVLVMYREAGANVPCADSLKGCRIKHDEDSHSSGNEVIMIKAQLSVFEVLRQGLNAVDVIAQATDYTP